MSELSGMMGLRERLQDGIPQAFQAISEGLVTEIQETFRKQMDPWGVPWKPHSASTLAIYAKGGFKIRGRAVSPVGGDRLLLASGTLMNRSFVPTHTPKSATVTVSHPAAVYAFVHQFGNPKNRLPNTRGNLAPIPARPFLPVRMDGTVDFPEAWMDEIMEIIRKSIMEGEII